MATFVDCPFCARRTEYGPRNPWRPFCSERCKTGDLGAWASDAYVVEGSPSDELRPDDPEPGPPPGHRQRN